MKHGQIALTALAAAAMALGTVSAQAAPAAATPAATAATQAAASAQPQRHFTSAIAAYAKKDYKAAASWASKDYREADHGLDSAAHSLHNAAIWSGKQAAAAAGATVADTKALGGKLVSGAAYTRDEVAKGFEALCNGIEVMGRHIVGSKTAPLS